MKPIRQTRHDAASCANALQAANSVVIDLETTGVHRHDLIVAVGVQDGRNVYILITNHHRELSSIDFRVTADDVRAALLPLSTRPDLQVIMHNASFDVAMLERAGVSVNCRVVDTLKLLKLSDSDRGRELYDGAGGNAQTPRRNRNTGDLLNYKLKNIARNMLHVNPLDFPGSVTNQPLKLLVQYLKSDLVITSRLYQRLQSTVHPHCQDYARRLIEPITTILVRMSETGVAADAEFISAEGSRILDLMQQVSAHHFDLYGQRLDVGDYYLRRWIYEKTLKCRRISSGKKQKASLRTSDILKLRAEMHSQNVRQSLELIHDYKQLQSLMTRLCALSKYVCPKSGRIFSTFNDIQSSGRVSSSRPNLQQIAGILAPGAKKQLLSQQFCDTTIRSRNAIVASEGHTLVAFDIAQADIRVLAHMVESFDTTGEEHLRKLQAERFRVLGKQLEPYWTDARQFLQLKNRKRFRCDRCWTRVTDTMRNGQSVICPKCGYLIVIPPKVPHFDPSLPCQLANDFRNSDGDFYSTATRRMLGRNPKDKTERNHMKQTILGIVNGMSAKGLASRLDVEVDEARRYLDAFAQAYPQVAAYKEITKYEFALTGRSWTFAGHHRRITSHHWMVTEPEVEIFVSYRGADKLWIRVVPLRPNRNTLTCWVISVVDAKYGSKNQGQEIYHHKDGRISQADYRFFRESNLIYRLPVRNISWRLIRHVRTRREEAVYDGYDKTWRQLFNHVAQGGTADIVKLMMLRCSAVCSRFAARLLLQIHDELVFEVPDHSVNDFVTETSRTLAQPPTSNFRVPIVIEPKVGKRFGELNEFRL
jgi:DNA polymerase I-like protein with 3'-5' exonuclease and polymerase domains/DNA-directed RNA polymerase subunit RPC12/RpoP